MNDQNFTYNLSDYDAIFTKTRPGSVEVFNKHEGGPQTRIGTYRQGRWTWDTEVERAMFFALLKVYPGQLQKALKAYLRSQREVPSMYTFSCLRRRFSIQVTKMERKWKNFIVENFYVNLR